MADVLAVRDEYRAQQWAMLIQESKSSGMTNKDFCILRTPLSEITSTGEIEQLFRLN